MSAPTTADGSQRPTLPDGPGGAPTATPDAPYGRLELPADSPLKASVHSAPTTNSAEDAVRAAFGRDQRSAFTVRGTSTTHVQCGSAPPPRPSPAAAGQSQANRRGARRRSPQTPRHLNGRR